MNQEQQEQLEELDEGPSRSQIKREMHAMQELGGRLMALSPKEWQQFPLDEDLMGALQESLRIKEKTARKRHRKRLGKLLSNADLEAIEAIFTRMDDRHQRESRRFHRLEQLRDRLVEDGDKALPELLATAPDADRQHLRQLIRQANKERDQQKPPAAARKLFKYLRGIVQD
jgi:ribosome-associated protein